MSNILPMPNKDDFEGAIRDIVKHGDLQELAGYLQRHKSTVSRWFNPNVDTDCPIYLTLAILWGYDNFNRAKSDAILVQILREREVWSVNVSESKKNGLSLTTEIFKKVTAFLESENTNQPIDDQITKLQITQDSVKEKLDNLISLKAQNEGFIN